MILKKMIQAKYVITVFIFMVMGVIISLPSMAQETISEEPNQGDGSEADPYQISNLANLRWLSESESVWEDNYFVQMSDINAGETKDWNSGLGFSPIGGSGASNTYFSGHYNGGNFRIDSLNIMRPSQENIGLFGAGNVVYIKDLNINAANIEGYGYCGGLIGTIDPMSDPTIGNIENVSVTNSFIKASFIVGAVAGQVNYVNIINSYSTGCTITANNNGAGFVSKLDPDVKIRNAYSNNIVKSGNSGGGFSSIVSNGARITNAYSTGLIDIENPSNAGFCPNVQGLSPVLFGYYDTETANNTTGAGVGLTTSEFLTSSSFNDSWAINGGGDSTKPWIQVEGLSRPFLYTENVAVFNGLPLKDTLTTYVALHNGGGIDSRGFRFAKVSDPDNWTESESDFSGIGINNQAITGVIDDTPYYIQSYAKDARDVYFGEIVKYEKTTNPVVITAHIDTAYGKSGTTLVGKYTYHSPVGNPEQNSTYQWLLSTNALGIGTSEIFGETDTLFTPSIQEQGYFIIFEVTPSDGTLMGEPKKSRGRVTYEPQTIENFMPTATMQRSDMLTLAATSTSGLTPSYTSGDIAIAEIIEGDKVIANAVGQVDITATQQGNVFFAAATPIVQRLTIEKGTQIITFDPLDDITYGDAPLLLNATSDSDLPITYISSHPNIVKIDMGTATFLSTGTVSITANQGGNNEYEAATPVVQVLNVLSKSQIITFDPIADVTFGDAPVLLNATSDSDLPVTYTSSDPNIIYIDMGKAIPISRGTVTITASQSGNDNYKAALPVDQELKVLGELQVITFDPIADVVYGDEPILLNATSDSDLPITYTSSDPNIVEIEIDMGSAIILAGGQVTITAKQIGNDQFAPATPVDQELNISAKTQTITFNPFLADATYGDAPLLLLATSDSDLPVEYRSSNTNSVQIDGDKAVFIATGTVTITALQPGDNKFEAAPPLTQELTVLHKSQIITFNLLGDVTFGDAILVLDATSDSDLPITYTSSNANIVEIDDDKAIFMSAGTATITALQPGDNRFAPALPVLQELTILPKPQVITFSPLPDVIYGDMPLLLTATSDSDLPVHYTSSDPHIVKITNDIANILLPGKVTITADQEGNSLYTPAESVIQSLTVKEYITGVTSVTQVLDLDAKVKIFPNPVSQTFTVDISGLELGNLRYGLELYSISGVLVYSIKNEMNPILTLDMSNKSQGIYILYIRMDTDVITKKIAKI